MVSSRTEREGFSGLFSSIDFDGTLEAAFLIKQTGIMLAAWTRAPVPEEIVGVMAATMCASMDTLVRTLGGDGPRSALLEIGDRRILTLQVAPNWTLLLVAPRSVSRGRLRREAQRIVEALPRAGGRPAPGHPAVHLRE